MKTSHILAIAGFLLLSLICNDVEDTLVHHYDTSIFAGFGHDSYFYPDWTRLYHNGDPAQGKTFIGQWMPFLVCGWHGFKIVRQFSLGTVLLILIWVLSENQVLYGWGRKWWIFYFSYMGLWFLVIFLLHRITYGYLFLKG